MCKWLCFDFLVNEQSHTRLLQFYQLMYEHRQGQINRIKLHEHFYVGKDPIWIYIVLLHMIHDIIFECNLWDKILHECILILIFPSKFQYLQVWFFIKVLHYRFIIHYQLKVIFTKCSYDFFFFTIVSDYCQDFMNFFYFAKVSYCHLNGFFFLNDLKY